MKSISKNLEEKPDLKTLLFLIGLQELNLPIEKFSKDQKLEVMHIAVCYLLEPFGYYEFIGKDKDGWPHFGSKKNLPPMKEGEQEKLLKISIIDYFENNSIYELN